MDYLLFLLILLPLIALSGWASAHHGRELPLREALFRTELLHAVVKNEFIVHCSPHSRIPHSPRIQKTQ